MEDPVAIQRYQGRTHKLSHMEWIQVAGTNVYLENSTREPMTIPYHGIGIAGAFNSIPFQTVTRPRSDVLEVIDRGIAYCQSWVQCSRIIPVDAWEEVNIMYPLTCLESWRTQVILDSIRRSLATRVIQRQFRKVISDPLYKMCQRRLLREFTDLVSVNSCI